MQNDEKSKANSRKHNSLFSAQNKRISIPVIILISFGILMIVFLIFREKDLKIKIGDMSFNIEIADTAESLQKGLSGRSVLSKNSGMLFVFPNSRRLIFWMKDTEFPLSLAYISDDGRIKELFDMEAMSDEEIPSKAMYRFALELPLGAFRNANAKIDTKIEIIDASKKYRQLFK